MDAGSAYIDAARTLGRDAFVAEHAGLYLLKRPLGEEADALDDTGQHFDTARFSMDSMRMILSSEEKRAKLLGEWADRWMVAPVRKRVETFPDRISIGRTNYCDIVLKLGFISKLHAHIFLTGNASRVELVDRSSNGTSVAGKPLETGVRTKVDVGTRIAFGALDVQLLDAGGVHDALHGTD